MNKGALVIGGNLAAVQAALDLAASGIKVYLVEKSPFLGDNQAAVAQHELTAEMLEAVKHPNVEIITSGQVIALNGANGNFQAIIQRSPRYVDLARCTACGDCVETCPITIPVAGTERKAIFGNGYGAVPNVFAIEKRGIAPCKAACPVGIHVQGYVALIAGGRFQEALDLIWEAVPFPGVLGRVCQHPCEEQCRRGSEMDQPVAICALKRFVADHRATPSPSPRPPIPLYPHHRVAIVGAGPAGLTAAYFLARGDIVCDVFEALPVAGGMMAVGIPAYRLPPDVLRREIADIEALGVAIHLNHPVDAAEWARLHHEYDTVFVAIGAHKDQSLNIPGEDLQGVLSGMDFLREVNLAREVSSSTQYATRNASYISGDTSMKPGTWNLKRTVVIGGGNVAIDSAMVARRLGAKEITILYRRSRAEMPAYPWEIAEAEEEGIHFYYQAAPVRAIGQNGRVTALECIRMELAEPDASGRRRPIPIPGSEFTIACDTLIAAVGQTVAYTFEGLAVSPRGTFQVNPVTLQTGLPGVFAGGDAVSGPASVVEAIAAGRRAAESIARYLCGENLAVGRTAKQPDVSGIEYYMPAQPVLRQRAEMPRLPLQKRPGFAEVALGFSQEQAVAEAQRCLSCGVCAECLACLRVCKPGAIQHNQTVEHLHLDVGAVIWADGDGHGVSSVSGSGVYVLQKDDLLEASVTAAQVIADIEAEARRAKSEELTTLHALRFTPHTPRIGVFVCRCGDEVDSVLDVDALVEAARSMPRVVHAQGLSFSCQPETAATIKEAVAGHGLNRVVLAACSCCSLDQVCYSCTYQRVRCKGYLERIGELCTILSPDTRHPLYLPVDFVNIREQCAWVHGDHPALAIAKAKRLIAAAIAKMRVTAVDVSSSLTTRYSVDPYRCRACGTCETVCELLAIRVGKANGRLVAKVDPALCRDCGTCVAHCPSGAITAGDLTDRQIAAMLVALLQE